MTPFSSVLALFRTITRDVSVRSGLAVNWLTTAFVGKCAMYSSSPAFRDRSRRGDWPFSARRSRSSISRDARCEYAELWTLNRSRRAGTRTPTDSRQTAAASADHAMTGVITDRTARRKTCTVRVKTWCEFSRRCGIAGLPLSGSRGQTPSPSGVRIPNGRRAPLSWRVPQRTRHRPGNLGVALACSMPNIPPHRDGRLVLTAPDAIGGTDPRYRRCKPLG